MNEVSMSQTCLCNMPLQFCKLLWSILLQVQLHAWQLHSDTRIDISSNCDFMNVQTLHDTQSFHLHWHESEKEQKHNTIITTGELKLFH